LNKNHRSNIGGLALALALCLPAAGALAREAPMVEPGRELLVSASASSPQTPERVRHAILEGSSRYGWRVSEDKPGRVTLVYDKGSHHAVIDVDYDAEGFQIKYRESSDLNFEVQDGKRYIHPNYNRWIANLGAAIRQANLR
jgi:hypothetical protein